MDPLPSLIINLKIDKPFSVDTFSSMRHIFPKMTPIYFIGLFLKIVISTDTLIE